MYFRYQDNSNSLGHRIILNAYILPFLLFGYGRFVFSVDKLSPDDRKKVCYQLIPHPCPPHNNPQLSYVCNSHSKVFVLRTLSWKAWKYPRSYFYYLTNNYGQGLENGVSRPRAAWISPDCHDDGILNSFHKGNGIIANDKSYVYSFAFCPKYVHSILSF